MDALSLPILYALLTAGAVAAPRAGRARAGAGLVAFALAMAALARSPGTLVVDELAREALLRGLTPSFLGITAGLLLAGVGAVASSGAVEAAGVARWRVAVPAVAALAAGVLLLPVLRASAIPVALGTAAGLALVAWLLARAGGALAPGRRLAALERRLGRGGHWLPDRGEARGRAALLALAVAALAPSLVPLTLGALVAALAAHLAARRARQVGPAPVLPVLSVLLVAVCWFLLTVNGTRDVPLRALPDVPLSEAAGRAAAGPLLLAALAFSGAPPLGLFTPGVALLPIALTLLLRVAAPAMPDALTYWRGWADPLLLLGLLWATARRDLPAALAALACMTALAPAAGPWLPLGLGAAALAALAAARLPALARDLLWLAVAAAVPFALGAVLTGQVTWAVLAAVALAALAPVWDGVPPDEAA